MRTTPLCRDRWLCLSLSVGWSSKDHSTVPPLLRILQSEWRMKALWPLKMAGSTHNDKASQQEDQNLQQQRCQNIKYLKFRCSRSHYYHQMTSMCCHLLCWSRWIGLYQKSCFCYLRYKAICIVQYCSYSKIILLLQHQNIFSAFIFKIIWYFPFYPW